MPLRRGLSRLRVPVRARGAALVLVAMWSIGVGALVVIEHLQERADERRQEQLLLARIRLIQVQLPQPAFGPLTGGGDIAKSRRQLADLSRRLRASAVRLDRTRARGRPSLEPLVERELASVDRVFALIVAGRPAAAATLYGLSEYAPGSPAAALRDTLDVADAASRADGRNARMLAYSGAGLAIGAMLLAFTIAFVRSILMRKRAEALARENERLFERSRGEALTDALTGLANRRKLLADVEELLGRVGGDTGASGLFDLDGFEAYNDTFGHPSGDGLLERLATRLLTAVEGRGTAYRMGGDEFCVVAQGPDGLRALDEAALALAEQGAGFTIGCSLGAVLLPQEATSLEEALRIADDRLYGQKRGRRDAEGIQVRDVLLRVLAEQSGDLEVHVGNVASLALATARALGLAPEESITIRLAAELHDVGKAAIPDAILNKPGPLDDEEWEFVRRHTLIGERILAAAPALAEVAPLVRSSHERADGTGYPDRLRLEQIPLGSRIIAVVDAYDAMTSERPYNRRLSVDEAVAELRRCAGTQFDPAVVEAFVTVLVSHVRGLAA